MPMANGMGPHGGLGPVGSIGYPGMSADQLVGVTGGPMNGQIWSSSQLEMPFTTKYAGAVTLSYEHIPNYTFRINSLTVTLKESELLEIVELYHHVKEMSEEFPEVLAHYTELRTLVKLHKD